jgi:hypothetical protein
MNSLLQDLDAHSHRLVIKVCILWMKQLKLSPFIFWWNTPIPPLIIYCKPSLGLTPKAKDYKGACQEWARKSHFMFTGVQENVKEWTPRFPSELHFGSWNPNGFLNLQRAIAEVKTHWIEDFLISLKTFWNLNV